MPIGAKVILYDDLNEAKEVAKLGFWNLAGNRLYYSAFHMASTLLLDKVFYGPFS